MSTTSRRATAIVAAGAILLGTSRLGAHDFWIEPSSFRPAPGASVDLRLRVGEHFVGDALPRNPALLAQFIAAGPGGVRPVPGRDGMDPAGVIRIEQPGMLVVGYRSGRSSVEQKPEAFDAYLALEGLERIAAVRATQPASQGVVRELFSRCAKSLLRAGTGAASGFDRVLGFTLEVVPEKNPYTMSPGAGLPVRVLYEGRPLAGVLVVALNRDDPTTAVRGRSGPDGRLSLRLSRAGAWLIKTVHMIPATAGSGAQWESLWASLTFELPPPASARPSVKRRK